MSKWQEKRLGEVAEINPESISNKNFYNTISYVDISSVKEGILYGVCNYSINNAPERAKRILRNNDIIISTVRPNLKAYYFVKNDIPNLICSTGFAVLRAKNKIVSRFLYYLISNESFINYLSLIAKGSAYPAVDKKDFINAKINIPDLATQEKIADILSTYDDLIENNNRRIEILEQMAQEIYKEWFVRFRFPGHEKVKFINGLPEGWEVKKIKDIVDRKPFGILYKESQVQEDGKVIVIDQSKKDYIGFHNNEPSHNADIEKPMILFGDHSCKYKIMIKPFSLAENVIPFTSNDENLLTTYYLFYSINGIIQTTEYKRHWTDLTNKKIIISNINLQTKFDEKIKEFLIEKEQLSIINQNLIKQRDLLLPRLMSGKLEV